MKNTTKLQELLLAYDKAEQLRNQTEALKPMLENEINATLAEGDALDENVARALQTKRAQLDLIPGKLCQIENRQQKLVSEISDEFELGYAPLTAHLRAIEASVKEKLKAKLEPLLMDLDSTQTAYITDVIFNHSKLKLAIAGCENPISNATVLGDYILRARRLISAEKQIVDEIEKLQTDFNLRFVA